MSAKIYEKLQAIQTGVITILLSIMISLIIINIITRFIFSFTISWSEECARYLFVQLIFLGCSLGIKENRQIRIDLIDNFLKGKAQKVIAIFQNFVAIVATVMLIIGGFGLIKAGFNTLSAGMRLPMHWFYICVPVGSLLAGMELTRQITLVIKGWKEEDA